jgi:hypothetical protein
MKWRMTNEEFKKMKRSILSAAIATAIGSSMACGSSPTNPTPAPTPTPANIAGSYELTLVASSTCSENLPPETRLLKYVADITQTGTLNNLMIMTLSAEGVAFGEVIISGAITGQEIKITQFVFSEKTTGGGIAMLATGTAIVAPNGSITGTLSGIYQTPSGASCNSTVHQIGLVKK